MNQDSQNPFVNTSHAPTVGQLASEEQMNFIRKTYVLFMAGILACVVMGGVTLSVDALRAVSLSILNMPILMVILIVGGSVGAQVLAQRPGLDVVALFGFTSLLGFIMGPVIASFAPSVLGQAALMSIVIFGALTAYAFVTRKDFSFMGGMLFVGIISLVGGSILNALLFKSFTFGYFISWGFLLVSSGFVLYQTSNLVHSYQRNQAGAAALGLFISFWNIFISLLNILGGDRD